MNLERFMHLLDAYGSDLERWPPAERDEAALVVQTSDAARQALADAERLDVALMDDGVPEPTAELRRRLAEVPLRHPKRLGWRAWWPFGAGYAPVLALSAALMVGLFVGDLAFPEKGVSVLEQSTALDRGTAPGERSSELSEDDVDELAELAFASDVSVGLEGDSALGTLEDAP